MNFFRCGLAAFTALAVLFGAGCDTLPGGDPPAGDLADNTPPSAETELARHNHLVTQLIAFALQHGVTALDPGDDPRCAAVARDAAQVAGFRVEAGAALKLEPESPGQGGETLIVSDPARGIVWRSLPPPRSDAGTPTDPRRSPNARSGRAVGP